MSSGPTALGLGEAADGVAVPPAQLLAYLAMMEQKHRDELDELEQQLRQARMAGERERGGGGGGGGGEVLRDVFQDDGAGPDEGSGELLSEVIDAEMPSGVVGNEAPPVGSLLFILAGARLVASAPRGSCAAVVLPGMPLGHMHCGSRICGPLCHRRHIIPCFGPTLPPRAKATPPTAASSDPAAPMPPEASGSSGTGAAAAVANPGGNFAIDPMIVMSVLEDNPCDLDALLDILVFAGEPSYGAYDKSPVKIRKRLQQQLRSVLFRLEQEGVLVAKIEEDEGEMPRCLFHLVAVRPLRTPPR